MNTTTNTSRLLANPEQVAAIRELIVHARKVGADYAIYPGDTTASGANYPAEHTWTLGTNRITYYDGILRHLSHGEPVLRALVSDARQAAQLLAAIGALPQHFAGGAR